MSVEVSNNITNHANDNNINDNNDNDMALPIPQYTPIRKQVSTSLYIRNNEEMHDSLNQLDDLHFFLKTAPVQWSSYQLMRRYYLNNDLGFITCILWNQLYYITGTDIVKCCIFQMEQFGRRVTQRKKFEEGIFSDLRNLKCGQHATLEQPRSDFLQFLFKNFCLKTQKKQKIFFWFSVPHLKLFVDALERDLKREKSHQNAATEAVSEPALSFRLNEDSEESLMDQLIVYLNNQNANDFININSPVLEPSDNTKNDSIANPDDDDDDDISNSIAPSHRSSRSSSSSVHLSPAPLSKTNLSLQLPTSFHNGPKSNHGTTEETLKIIHSSSGIVHSNQNSSNPNNIVTHTLILNPKPDIIPSASSASILPNNNGFTDRIETFKTNNNNSNNNTINNNNNNNSTIEKSVSNNDYLFSPLNTDFNNIMNNLKDKDFPLDYLPVMEENSDKNIKQEDTNIPSMPENNNSNNNNDDDNNNINSESDDDENIVVPVTIGNLNKNNRNDSNIYLKSIPFHSEITSNNNTINPRVMTNKEYYSMNNKDALTNKNAVTLVASEQQSKSNTSKKQLSSTTNEFPPVPIENDKDTFFNNELLDYDQYNNTDNNDNNTTNNNNDNNNNDNRHGSSTGLRITEATRVQENAGPYDDFSLWANTVVPTQGPPPPPQLPYTMNMGMNMNQYVVPAPQPPYNSTITPVTKYNPYMSQSPWGVTPYPPGAIYGMNISPRLGATTTTQPFIIHPSRRPYSRPTSSLSKQFPMNSGSNTSTSSRTGNVRVVKPSTVVKPIDLRNVKIQRRSDNEDIF